MDKDDLPEGDWRVLDLSDETKRALAARGDDVCAAITMLVHQRMSGFPSTRDIQEYLSGKGQDELYEDLENEGAAAAAALDPQQRSGKIVFALVRGRINMHEVDEGDG